MTDSSATTPSRDITQTQAWKDLQKLHAEKTEMTLRELFNSDEQRAQKYTFDAAGLHVDLSKNLVDEDVLDALVALAEEAGLKDATERMFQGAHINSTEDRAVLHLSLIHI